MEHHYRASLVWTGNHGRGTASNGDYGREYTITIDGRPDLPGSADAHFRGDASRHSPEDLFLADGSDEHAAAALHDVAHAQCFIANSCSVPISHHATTEVER